MQLETLKAIEVLIEKFGFPIFVAICGLFLFAAVFRYMREALEKKDCDFLQYVEKRDAQIDGIVEKHNQAFRENTDAINQMRSAIAARTEYVKEQTNVLTELTSQQQK
jgi:hypothetical protein